MSTKQGDVGLLREPLAQELLQAKGPAWPTTGATARPASSPSGSTGTERSS